MRTNRKKIERKKGNRKPEYCVGCIHENEDPCPYTNSCPYYQTGIAKKMKDKCIGCPYGKAFPCIGFCMKEVLAKDRNENEGKDEDNAG